MSGDILKYPIDTSVSVDDFVATEKVVGGRVMRQRSTPSALKVTPTGGGDAVTLADVAASVADVAALVEDVAAADLAKIDGITNGTSAAGKAMVTDANNQMDGVPLAERLTVDPSQKVTYFTDFLGDALEDELLAGVGGGTGNAVALSAGAGGRVSLTTASDDGDHSANGVSIGLGALDWRADQGGLAMEVRLQIDDITDVALFVGFTDTIGSTVEAPLFLAAADFDSDADNACGVVFDTDATTDEFAHGGVKATADTAPAFSGGAPTAATYVTIRVEVSAAGAVQGFIDGTAIGAAVANAVTITTPLVPIVFVHNRGAAARVALLDYVWVQANR